MSDTAPNPLDYFRARCAETGSRSSAANMARAIDSLSRFAAGTDLTFGSFDTAFLGEWVARQMYHGYYAKTVAYNLSKISALYNKAVADGLASPTDAFALTVARVRSAGSRYDGINHTDTFKRLRGLSLAPESSLPALRIATDIITFGILCGGLTLEQIADFKKDRYAGDNPSAAQIVKRYARPRGKYLFPLYQSRTTPRRVQMSLQSIIAMRLQSAGFAASPVGGAILADLWCDIAMSCGFSAAEIAACTGPHVTNAITYCVEPAPIAPERISAIRATVAEALTDNPVHWYAMHLRRHVEFKDLTARLRECAIDLDEIFYPMEEIMHRIGKKRVFEHRPVISWLVFYRARVTMLPHLFHHIGDLAWGYRYLRDVKSPYAVISDTEVRHYQQALGTITPGTHILDDDQVQFRPGDHLVLLGGPMHGRHGILIAEKKEKGDTTGRVIFRISLSGGKSASWEVNWDPRLVKKITAAQYAALDTTP